MGYIDDYIDDYEDYIDDFEDYMDEESNPIGILIFLLGIFLTQGMHGLENILYGVWVILGLVWLILITFFKVDLIKIAFRFLYSIVKRKISKRRY